MKPDWKSIFFKSLTILLVFVSCYFLCEIVIFCLYRKTIPLFPRYVTGTRYQDFRIRTNIPNARYRHKSHDGTWEFRINPQGFRSDVFYPHPKPEGVVRVLTLGDSFTVGYEVNGDQTYSAVLEKILNRDKIRAQVINGGVSGFGTAEELVFFEQEGVRYHPDILILGFFNNDFMDNIRADLYRLKDQKLVLHNKTYLPAIKARDFLNSLPFYRWLSENSYLHNYLNVVATVLVKDEMNAQHMKDMLAEVSGGEGKDQKRTPEQYQAELARALLKKVYAVAKENGIYFILMDIPDMSLNPSLPPDFHAEELCDYFFDAAGLLKKYRGKEPLYWVGGQKHWTPEGHQIAAEHLAGVIENLIQKGPEELKGAGAKGDGQPGKAE